jgi:hypothetical protein
MVHIHLKFLSEWRELPSAPCLAGKKIDESSRLGVVEISRIARRASFRPLLQEDTCNSGHEQTSLSNDTIDSVLRHREAVRAKDLLAPPHRYMDFLLQRERTSFALIQDSSRSSPHFYYIFIRIGSMSA